MPCVYQQRTKHLYVIKRRVQSAKAELVNERLPVLEPYLESASKQATAALPAPATLQFIESSAE